MPTSVLDSCQFLSLSFFEGSWFWRKLSSQLIAIQCTIAIDIYLLSQTSSQQSNRNGNSLRSDSSPAPSLRKQHVEIVSSSTTARHLFEGKWDIHITTICISHMVTQIPLCMGNFKDKKESQTVPSCILPQLLLHWIQGNATCHRAHAHWYCQTLPLVTWAVWVRIQEFTWTRD